MGPVVTVVIQIRVWTRITNLHPDSITCYQVERQLEGQRTVLRNGAFILSNSTRPDWIPVQIKIRNKINSRWIIKMRRSREREKINSRSRCREFPGVQIHGVSLVHPRQLERNRISFCGNWRISRDVEMDRRRFDVGVSNPFLFVCKQNQLGKTITNTNSRQRTILIGIKVAVNHFHLLWSFYQKESAQFMSYSLHIRTRGGNFSNVDYFTGSGCWIKFFNLFHKFKILFTIYHLIWSPNLQRRTLCCSIPFSLMPNLFLQFPRQLKLLNKCIPFKLNQLK